MSSEMVCMSSKFIKIQMMDNLLKILEVQKIFLLHISYNIHPSFPCALYFCNLELYMRYPMIKL